MLYILLLLIGILVVCTNGYSIGRISRSSIVRSRTRLYQTFQEYLKNNGSSGSSSSSSSSSSSKTSISDADFEDLLMSGDNAVPTVVDEPPPTTTTEKGSGVQELFTIATTILAKTKVTDLRALISKYDSTKLPDINADSETHISMALDTVWALKGDWDELIVLLNQELGEKAKIGEEFMNKAVVIGSTLTLDKIKELIVKYKDKSALPRINKGNQSSSMTTTTASIIIYYYTIREVCR